MATKNVLMLVILSAGLLTGVTATMTQATPVFADTEDCKKNDDNNCNTVNEKTQSINQENNCSINDGGGNANGGSAGDSGTAGAGSSSGNDNSFTCSNNLIDPNTGDNSFNPP